MHPILLGVLVFMALAAIASVLYRASSSFRKQLDNEARDRTKKEKRRFGIDIGILIAVGKYVWEWQHAPDGSLQKLGWHLFVAAAIAFAIWMILRLIDRAINRREPATARGYQSALGDES